MNLHKVNKKVPHVDSRQTLEALHEEKLQYFKNYYATLPDKRMQLEQLMTKAQTFQTEVTMSQYSQAITEKMKLEKQIEDLETEIKSMEDRTEEMEYLLKCAPFFMKSCENEEVHSEEEELGGFVKKKKVSKRGEICQLYASACLDMEMGVGKKKATEHKSLICEDCMVPRILNTKEASAVCPECATVVRHQDSIHHMEYSEEIEILSPFAYLLICVLKSIVREAIRLYFPENTKAPKHGTCHARLY